MSQPTIYSIVRSMESLINLMTENTTEAEYLFKMGYSKKSRKLLVETLEEVEKTVSMILSFVENGESLDNIMFKAASKELLHTLNHLQASWISGVFTS